MKIDVQGYESQVLAGMGPVRPIIIDIEISFIPLYKNSSIFYDIGKTLYDMLLKKTMLQKYRCTVMLGLCLIGQEVKGKR